MKKINIDFEKIYMIIREQVKWFFFQIMACYLPVLFLIYITWYVEKEIIFFDFIQDYLLATFAVGLNIFAFEIHKKDYIPIILKDLYLLSGSFITICSFGVYLSLFGKYTRPDIFIKMRENITANKIIFIGGLSMILLNTLIAVFCNIKEIKMKENANSGDIK